MSVGNRVVEALTASVFVVLVASAGLGLLPGCGYDGIGPGNILDVGGSTTPAASITSFSPTTAVVGTTITVIGANFLSSDQFVFTGVATPQAVSSVTSTSLQVVIPEDAYAGTVSLWRDGASNVSSTYNVQPVISAAWIPGAAAGGTATVRGSGFNHGTYGQNQLYVGTVNQPFTIVNLPAGENTGQATFAAAALPVATQAVRVVVNGSLSSNSVTTNVAP